MAARVLRPIRVVGNVAYIPLTKGHEAIIDAADVPLVEDLSWRAVADARTVYAVSTRPTGSGRETVQLHRVLTSAATGTEIDHIDGDGLNNRRVNLRRATHAENCRNARRSKRNTSGHKGVCWSEQHRQWRARIMAEGRRLSIGLFDTPEEAHAAYVEEAKRLHGEFARAA